MREGVGGAPGCQYRPPNARPPTPGLCAYAEITRPRRLAYGVEVLDVDANAHGRRGGSGS